MKELTVIIADYAPFIHLQEPVNHRSVKIKLTDEQAEQFKLGKNEHISQCFIEEK